MSCCRQRFAIDLDSKALKLFRYDVTLETENAILFTRFDLLKQAHYSEEYYFNSI